MVRLRDISCALWIRNGINEWDREENCGDLPLSRRQLANHGGLSAIRAEFVRHPD